MPFGLEIFLYRLYDAGWQRAKGAGIEINVRCGGRHFLANALDEIGQSDSFVVQWQLSSQGKRLRRCFAAQGPTQPNPATLAVNTFQIRRFASQTKPMQDDKARRSLI